MYFITNTDTSTAKFGVCDTSDWVVEYLDTATIDQIRSEGIEVLSYDMMYTQHKDVWASQDARSRCANKLLNQLRHSADVPTVCEHLRSVFNPWLFVAGNMIDYESLKVFNYMEQSGFATIAIQVNARICLLTVWQGGAKYIETYDYVFKTFPACGGKWLCNRLSADGITVIKQFENRPYIVGFSSDGTTMKCYEPISGDYTEIEVPYGYHL